MMYIGNTFYDDMRHPTNLEYSETVLKWAKHRGLVLGRKAKMEDTTILDLTLKLGYPYLYQHQGNCEHLFCFSDVRWVLLILFVEDLLSNTFKWWNHSLFHCTVPSNILSMFHMKGYFISPILCSQHGIHFWKVLQGNIHVTVCCADTMLQSNVHSPVSLFLF